MRELGSPAAAKSGKTMPKSLKENSREGKSLRGVSFLPIQFLTEILEKKRRGRKIEKRYDLRVRHGFGCFRVCTSPPEQQLKRVLSWQGATSTGSVINTSAFIGLHMFRTLYKYRARLIQALNLHKPWQRALVPIGL